MRRRRNLLILAAGVALAATFVRVGFTSLGWGGYVSVDLVLPWKR